MIYDDMIEENKHISLTRVITHCEYFQEELQREIEILKEELAANNQKIL